MSAARERIGGAEGHGGGPLVEVLVAPPSAGGQVAAVGPTDREGVFVAFVPGIGFRYLNLAKRPGCWATAAGYAGTTAPQLGLHYLHAGGAKSCVSLVESPPRRWACLELPAPGDSIMSMDKAAVLETVEFKSDIVAVCRHPGSPQAALIQASGSFRFMDLATGKAAGKAVKLDVGAGGAGAVLIALGPRRIAAVLPGEAAAGGAEFFIVELEDGESPKAAMRLQGRIAGIAFPPAPNGSYAGALQAAAAGSDRLLLSWGSTGAPSFASVALDREAPVAELLSPSGDVAPVHWLCVKGHVVEWRPAAKGVNELELVVRDARYGMVVASLRVPAVLGAKGSARARVLAASAGDVTVLTGASGLAAVQWGLPQFSLQSLIGSRVNRALKLEGAGAASLAPLREAACSKRKRDDPAVEELFSAKRRATTDKDLAEELRRHTWLPTHELVDVVVRHKCLASAEAMLSLPELGEDLSVRLLSVDPGMETQVLAMLVRRASTNRLLEASLADHLPAAMLPAIVEALLAWLQAYRDYPESVVQEYCPGLPRQAEIVRFLSALSDGCLPTILRLDADLLERASEQLGVVKKNFASWERLYSSVRATVRISGGGVTKVAAVEAVLLDF